MGYPQNETHWSSFHPILHFGPVTDCQECRDEREEWGAVDEPGQE